MSPIVAAFLRSALIPAVMTALILFRVRGGKPFLSALILSLGFTLGSYLLIGRFSVPPTDVSETLAVVAILFSTFVWMAPAPAGARYALRAVFVIAAVALLFWPLRETVVVSPGIRNLIAFLCLAVGVWSIVERVEPAVTTASLIALPLVSLTALSLLLVIFGSAAMSQQVSILCCQLGGLLVLSLLRPAAVPRRALLPYLSAFVVLFMMCGHFYLDINPWFMVYLCWPFAVLWLRPYVRALPKTWYIEAPVLGAVSAVPLGWFLWQQFQAAGPLY